MKFVKYVNSTPFSIAKLTSALLLMVATTILGCGSDSGLIEHQSFTFRLDVMSTSTVPNNTLDYSRAVDGPNSPSDVYDSIPVVTIRALKFHAEIATTQLEKAKGLSGRESLPQKTGMLFIFQQNPAPAFWMKGMEFDLDFVWIDSNCEVVSTTVNVPAPISKDDKQLPTYASGKPAYYVFEINAGEVFEHGIEVGDPVKFSGIQIDGEGC